MFNRFFKPIPAWDMERAKQYMADHGLDDYTLLDVRQDVEYADVHIPGAIHVPLHELPNRLGELDRDKLTLVYCLSGGRAGNGTALLSQAGFDAHNIGGIRQWQGAAASGGPEAGMAVFDAAITPAEYAAVAWAMEEGARLLYQELAARFPELDEMFQKMAVGEGHHRDLLVKLHAELGGDAADLKTPDGAIWVEGGIPLDKILAWSDGRTPGQVLDYLVAVEANAHDRYIRVGRGLGGDAEQAFIKLAEAERRHMEELLAAFLAQPK